MALRPWEEARVEDAVRRMQRRHEGNGGPVERAKGPEGCEGRGGSTWAREVQGTRGGGCLGVRGEGVASRGVRKGRVVCKGQGVSG